MKYQVLDPPKIEIEPTKLLCCAYSLIGWTAPPGQTNKPMAKGVKAKSLSNRTKRADRCVAA